ALFAAARTTIASGKSGPAEYAALIRLLGRGLDHQQDDVKTLAGLLTPQTPEELQTAAVAALGKVRSKDVPPLLLRGWKRYGPGVRAQALDVLLARADTLPAVLHAVERKLILPFEIDAARRQRLLDHKSAAVRERARKLL